MPEFSETSKAKLRECHRDLVRVFNEVVKRFDCVILEGFRGKEDQDKAFRDGHSKLQWPNGKHNRIPSIAVDVAPYPTDFKGWDDEWKKRAQLYFFAGYVMSIAATLSVNLVWGGDWSRTGDYTQNKFDDLYHFEVVLA